MSHAFNSLDTYGTFKMWYCVLMTPDTHSNYNYNVTEFEASALLMIWSFKIRLWSKVYEPIYKEVLTVVFWHQQRFTKYWCDKHALVSGEFQQRLDTDLLGLMYIIRWVPTKIGHRPAWLDVHNQVSSNNTRTRPWLKISPGEWWVCIQEIELCHFQL